jgi:FixJ family two-component response regulator
MSQLQTVFLVDDQPAVLKGLGRLLDSAGYTVQAYTSAQEFLDSGNAAQQGCLVLDLSMPGMDGLALQQQLAARASVLPVIFLTGHGDIDSGVHAMKLGAADFLTKPVDDDRLLAAIELAFAKNSTAHRQDAERLDILARMASLTEREREVMDLVIEGALNKQIAATLGAAEKTVKVHRGRVMAKMQVRSVSALVRLVDRVRQRTTAA